MGFSPKIKEDILVASARYCCVCHRYKGVKVEVHHIRPKEQGGKDTAENAIALCFDCHADAGHYYSNHPKGSKFSPSELRKHKLQWFSIVQSGTLEEEDIQPNGDAFLARYMVTSNFEIMKEITQNDLCQFPVQDAMLLRTPALSFLTGLMGQQDYRTGEYYSDLSISARKYMKKYPDAVLSDEAPLYIHERIPSVDDVKLNCSDDGLTNYLLYHGVDVAEISQVVTYHEECGDGGFTEVYLVRPMYILLLVLTNISGNAVGLTRLEGLSFDGVKYCQNECGNNKQALIFPGNPILPNQSVVVPIGVFLTDFEGVEFNTTSYDVHELSWDYSQALIHGEIHTENMCEFVGPSFNPFRLNFQNGVQAFHEYDFSNMYWINRDWQCGSCPHLFFESDDGVIEYQRELFSKKPNEFQSEMIDIPDSIKTVIVAELEKETTTINHVQINMETVAGNITLNENSEFRLPVKPYDRVQLLGKYTFNSSAFRKMPIIQKEILVKKYIKENSTLRTV